MTQKELLYFEDAIKHEENLISMLDLSIENLEDNKLIEFMKSEKKIHEKIKKDLLNLLEGNNDR